MRSIVAALAVLVLTCASSRAQEDRWDARIAAVSGEAVVRPADGSGEAAAEVGMPLEEGDQIAVAEGGSAEISLDAGSLMTLRANSTFTVEKTAKGDASFFLQVGSLLAKIQKLREYRLRVRTPTAVAAVRGTEFAVEADQEESHVGVFDEGKVEVSGQTGAPETLISNQETSVRRGMAPGHAVQLKRFVARRALMRGHARRIAVLRAKWRALPPAERQELRRSTLGRMREMYRERAAKRMERLKKRDDEGARREMMQKQRRNMLENRRKMEERRKMIRRRGPGDKP